MRKKSTNCGEAREKTINEKFPRFGIAAIHQKYQKSSDPVFRRVDFKFFPASKAEAGYGITRRVQPDPRIIRALFPYLSRAGEPKRGLYELFFFSLSLLFFPFF